MVGSVIRLDGFWYCQFGALPEGEEVKTGDLPSWSKAPVPKPLHEVFTLPEAWTGEVTYARVFRTPELGENRAFVLRFAGVYPPGEVFVNGTRIGETSPGGAVDSFDVTSSLGPEENLLVVRLREDLAPGFPRPDPPVPLGIWAPVWFEVRPRLYLQLIKTNTDGSGFWEVELRFSDVLEHRRNIRLELAGPQGSTVSRLEQEVQGARVFKFTPPQVREVRRWDLDYPTLYRLNVTAEGEEIERRGVDCGFRSLKVEKDGVFLNGRPIFLRCVWDDFVFPGWGRTVPSAWALMRRLRTAKELGFNTVLCAGTVPDLRCPLLADRLGLLLWYELPSPGAFHDGTGDKIWRILQNTLDRDSNSPSLAFVNVFRRSLPRKREALKAWAERALPRCVSPSRIVLPGPAPFLSGLSRCSFLDPESEEAVQTGNTAQTEKQQKCRIVWPVAAPCIPELKGKLGGAVQALGDPDLVLKDLAAAQAESLLSRVTRARTVFKGHGYMVRRLYDSRDERRGMISPDGKRREAAGRLMQGDDWAGVSEGARVFHSGGTVSLRIAISHLSGRDLAGGGVGYNASTGRGRVEIHKNQQFIDAGTVSFSAVKTVAPKEERMRVVLESPARHVLAESDYTFQVVPKSRCGRQRLYLGEELLSDSGFVNALKSSGYTVLEKPAGADLGVWACFRYDLTSLLQRGMRGIFLFESKEGLPENAGLSLQVQDCSETYLWLRSDSSLLSPVVKKRVGGAPFDALVSPLYFDGVWGKNLRDVLAAFLSAHGRFFRPVLFSFRLGHGMGIMCTLPLRRLYTEGELLGTRILESAISSLRPGGLPRPRFVPELSPMKTLVPASREGSTLWRFAFSVSTPSWHTGHFNDSKWPRARGAFGRRGGPGLVLRYTWERPDIYLRAEFTVERVPRVLRLFLFHDRDVEVAINGRFVLERAGYTTRLTSIDLSVNPAEVLRRGKNLIAVHCHQDRRSHNLDVGLVGVY